MSNIEKKLYLEFHGRIIDHLGIQMYQSPVAAVAELISNAWDADAEKVDISLPEGNDKNAALVIKDNGNGMTFEECQNCFLKIGRNRRGTNPQEKTRGKQRPVLGRKGIGKFAGFGIADVMQIDTISAESGERTIFVLDKRALRSDDYITNEGTVKILTYEPPDKERTKQHGTTVSLQTLTIKRSISPEPFCKSMARRFLLWKQSDNFNIKINSKPLPSDIDISGVEYIFPRDWESDKIPSGIYLRQNNGWAVETLPNGKEIKWKIFCFENTIGEEGLRGISVFSNGKLAQMPFFFNITGGISGQHALEYMSGQVQADFIDGLDEDIIATERQRINWENEEAKVLEEWGQERIKMLANYWKSLRGAKRRQEIESKISEFAQRLNKLPTHEKETLRQALNKLGGIETLSECQFREIGNAVLQAWEQGRLRNLISKLSDSSDISADDLLKLLVEADVLVALNIAESIRTKLEAIRGLEQKVEAKELENAVRDYISEKPYLLDPKWETFKKETSLKHILDNAAKKANLAEEPDEYGNKRVDLALKSSDRLLVVEFMRPGKKADFEHLGRCRLYVFEIRSQVKSQTALGIKEVSGLLVADELDKSDVMNQEIISLSNNDIQTLDWKTLLSQSKSRWQEYLDIIGERSPNDERIQSLTKR